jgi:hypothetical protein
VFDPKLLTVGARGVTYYLEDIYNPSFQIKELDNLWDYSHVQAPQSPYPYKLIQDKGTGVIHADRQEFIYSGRSNNLDGYVVYQIPADVTASEIRVMGSFANLGGNAWWQLE